MKILELIHSLEEAYHRFGDIEVKMFIPSSSGSLMSPDYSSRIKEIIIESEEVIIKGGNRYESI